MRTGLPILALVAAAILAGCGGGGGGSAGTDQLRCDQTGCQVCDSGTCYTYYCDDDNQCPTDYTCAASGRCLYSPAPDGTGDDDVPDGDVACDETNPCPASWTCGDEGVCVREAECATECCANADCADGSICSRQGACVPAPVTCSDTVPCPLGKECDGGVCRATAVPGCSDEAPCDAGETCIDGACVVDTLPPRPAERCVLASDCGTDGTCIDGACHFPCDGDVCPVTQACVGGLCLARSGAAGECVTGADCAVGGARCINATCRPVCAADAECGRHERCNTARGLCEPDPRPIYECLSNDDCPTAKDCVDGRCLAQCVADDECGESATCEQGYCALAFSCLDSTACGEGEVCVNGRCDVLL